MKKSYLLSGMIVLGIAASVNASEAIMKKRITEALQGNKRWADIYDILGKPGNERIVNTYHDPSSREEMTLLATAILDGDKNQVEKLLVVYKADPNMAVGMGGVFSERTPLMLAAINGYSEIAQLLLEHGADPYIMDTLDDKRDVLQVPGVQNNVIELIRKWMRSHPRTNKISFVSVTK